MAFFGPQLSLTGMTAGADLSAHQYRFVKVGTTAPQVIKCNTDGEKVLAVLLNKPGSVGDSAELVFLGQTKVEAGEAIPFGSAIKTDSVGRAAVAEITNTGADVGDTYVGTALEAASAAGDLITVVIGIPQGRVESV